MIIVNADDWGRTAAETDAAMCCYKAAGVTSTSAMVFMEDSERAASLAKATGMDVGLHLNLSQPFTGQPPSRAEQGSHNRIVRFLTLNKYSLLIYNPLLRRDFRSVYEAQVEEFIRLYAKPPSHIDGHQHMHLCANIVLDNIIPDGAKVRRNLSFFPGDKGRLNRAYRRLIDRSLARRYRLTDYFFGLPQCLETNRITQVAALAKSATVEVMAHPVRAGESAFLMSEQFAAMLMDVERGTYCSV